MAAQCLREPRRIASSSAAAGIDRAFVAEMIPHHESAVEMAEIAQRRGRHPEIKELTEAIVKNQNAEIDTMKGMATEMDKAGVKPGDLGMDADHMGMGGDMRASRRRSRSTASSST